MSAGPTTTPVPAPVIPYGDPTTGSTDQQLSYAQSNSAALTAENQAQQITSASLSAYGSLPNPQVAFEAITTGATPTIASMIQAGNPLFQAELAGAPAGQNALTTPYPSVPSKINDPAQSLWNAPSAQEQKNTLNNSPSWKGFGTAPEMNFAWMQQQSQGPPAQTTKWQNLLKQRGFLGTPTAPYQTSGVWDKATEAAFQGFLTQWATPYALFSTDATTRGNANEFLSGLGVDTATLTSTIGHSPSTLAQIAQGWMATQGPTNSLDPKSDLQKYADQFGSSALPDSYQAILQSNFGQTVRDTFASLPFVESIPLVSGVYNAALNVATGNVGDLQHAMEDPRQAHAQAIEQEMRTQDNLTQADVNNLSPVLQQVADDSGFLGFMSSYDNARTTGILTVFDLLKDFSTGHIGKNMNPFDPGSTPRIEAAAANDNLMAGLFGQGWVNDNPTLATFLNMGANMLDDPTSYLPLVGEIEAIRRSTMPMLGGARAVAGVIGKDETMRAFANVTADTARMRINQGFFNAARTAYKLPEGRGLTDATRMFGLSGAGGANDVRKLRLIQQVMEHPDEQKAWDLFSNGNKDDPNIDDFGFGYLANGGRGLYNQKAAWTSLTQVKSVSGIGKIRAMGGFNIAKDLAVTSDPIGTAQFFDNMSWIAGMQAKDIKPLLDAYHNAVLTDPNNVMKAVHALEDAVMTAYSKNHGVKIEDLQKWVGDAKQTIVSYRPDPIHGTETSYVLKQAGKDDAETRASQAALNQHQEDLKVAQATGASPETLAMLQDKISGIGRPAPGMTTQFANEYTFPYSPFDMIVYKNRAFRTAVKLQRASGLDKVMDTWRRITIGRVSSAMRMDIGDDMIRPFAALIGMGQWRAGFSYLIQSLAKMVGLILPSNQVLRSALGAGTGFALGGLPGAGIGGAVGAIMKGRHQVLEDLNAFLEHNPEGARMFQDIGKIAQETDTRIWNPTAPTEVGYTQGLIDQLNNHWTNDPLSQAWLKAPEGEEEATLRKFLQESDDPVVQAWIKSRNMNLDPKLFDYQVKSAHDFMSTYFRNPTIRKMAATGKINQRVLSKLVHDEGTNPNSGLPILQARQNTPFARANATNLIRKGPEWIFEHVTGPAINSARAGGFMKMQGLYEQQMRKYFEHDPRMGTQAFEDAMARESASRAYDWIVNNTYQGTRSVMGATLRNVMPFYGATANMDKFYMKMSQTTPFVGSAIMHTLAQVQASQSQTQQNNPGTTLFNGVLAHAGFGAGEALQVNPLQAFFLTGDGIGSMVPGTGPVFAPLWTLASHINNGNNALAQILIDVIPGAAQQIDYNTGAAKPQFSYLAHLLTGASMAVTGQNVIPNIPGLTESADTVNTETNAAVQQWERANNRALDPTSSDYNSVMDGIRRQVGRDQLLQGAASFTLPVSPQVINEQNMTTQNNVDNWRAQTTPGGQDAILLQSLPGVTKAQWQAALDQTAGAPTVAQLIAKAGPTSDAALMAYEDSRVAQSDRDTIAQQSPWVVSASASKYQTANLGPQETNRPFDLPQWQIMRTNGDITALTPDQFVGNIANERDINTGWLEYENLKDQEYQAMQQNGWTTTSPQYTAWNAAYFQPQLIALGNNHPAWQKMFGSGGGTTAADLANQTRALRTLQTWEVLPQHSDYENTQTILWRNAIQLRDNAAGQIYALKLGGGSSTEQQMVMATFQANLASLAAQDPNFAAQLAGFRFSSWENIVSLEADEMQANQYAGYPAQVGPQGSG